MDTIKNKMDQVIATIEIKCFWSKAIVLDDFEIQTFHFKHNLTNL